MKVDISQEEIDKLNKESDETLERLKKNVSTLSDALIDILDAKVKSFINGDKEEEKMPETKDMSKCEISAELQKRVDEIIEQRLAICVENITRLKKDVDDIKSKKEEAWKESVDARLDYLNERIDGITNDINHLNNVIDNLNGYLDSETSDIWSEICSISDLRDKVDDLCEKIENSEVIHIDEDSDPKKVSNDLADKISHILFNDNDQIVSVYNEEADELYKRMKEFKEKTPEIEASRATRKIMEFVYDMEAEWSNLISDFMSYRVARGPYGRIEDRKRVCKDIANMYINMMILQKYCVFKDDDIWLCIHDRINS